MPNIYPNRRHQKAMNLTAHVIHIVAKYCPDDKLRDVSREIEDLFYTSGVDIITEADRIQAGLMPRDHNGMTLEEIKVLDARYMKAMLEPMRPYNEGSK